MAYQIFKLPKAVALDTSANVYPGAKLNFYLTATDTRTDTYTTSALGPTHQNPVVADSAGVFPAIYLDPEITYKVTFTDANDVLLYTVDPVNDDIGITGPELSSTTAGSDGSRLVGFRRNASGSIAETVHTALARNVEAASFGFATDASAATNAAAIAAAIAELGAAGGTVHLPAGTFNCNPFNIPAFCYVRGRGYATQLLFASASDNIKVGGDLSGVSKYKCGISDISFVLSHKDGHGIRLMETIGAEVARIYGEGTLTASRSNRFLTVDGGDVSSFFNRVTDCIANHFQTGYVIETTGTEAATQQFFDNCTSFGDVGSFADSIGFVVRDEQGSGSVWTGGNMELCGTGIEAEAGCMGFSILGARFEGNTIDALSHATSGPHTYLGCLLDPGKITNAERRAAFVGCMSGSNTWLDHVLPGGTVHVAEVTTQTPLIVEGFPGDTTTETLILRNSAGQKLFSVTNQGKFARINNAAPVTVAGSRGGNAALADLLTTLAATGIIVDGTSA